MPEPNPSHTFAKATRAEAPPKISIRTAKAVRHNDVPCAKLPVKFKVRELEENISQGLPTKCISLAAYLCYFRCRFTFVVE